MNKQDVFCKGAVKHGTVLYEPGFIYISKNMTNQEIFPVHSI